MLIGRSRLVFSVPALAALLAGACSGPAAVPLDVDMLEAADLDAVDAARSAPDLARPDMARAVDGGALFCAQEIGDGGNDALGAGAACDPRRGDRCAAPVACSFESFGYDAACTPVVRGDGDDGGAASRCCQFASVHSMVDGSVERCLNCGDGWICSSS